MATRRTVSLVGPVPGLLAIALAWALLGCCCPALPLMVTRSDRTPTAASGEIDTASVAVDVVSAGTVERPAAAPIAAPMAGPCTRRSLAR